MTCVRTRACGFYAVMWIKSRHLLTHTITLTHTHTHRHTPTHTDTHRGSTLDCTKVALHDISQVWLEWSSSWTQRVDPATRTITWAGNHQLYLLETRRHKGWSYAVSCYGYLLLKINSMEVSEEHFNKCISPLVYHRFHFKTFKT